MFTWVLVDPQVLENLWVFDSQLWVSWWLKPTGIQVWHFEFEIPMGTDPGHPQVHSCSALCQMCNWHSLYLCILATMLRFQVRKVEATDNILNLIVFISTVGVSGASNIFWQFVLGKWCRYWCGSSNLSRLGFKMNIMQASITRW
jgi:hypothetical protein